MSVVRRTKAGNLVWESPEAKRQAIAHELQLRGFNLSRIEVSDLKNKYYLVRSSTTYSKHLVGVFATKAEADKYWRDWHVYDRLYDRISIEERDFWEVVAANRILGL